jgi:formylglycine-generating enzyme required for sulfatase activity
MERALAPFLRSEDWEPLFSLSQYGVYASRWGLRGQNVWTVVNRNEYDVREVSLGAEARMRYFDLYHGVELQPSGQLVRFAIEAHGFGAILATPTAPDGSLKQLMEKMQALTQRPLAQFANEWKVLPQRIVDGTATSAASEAPEGMIRIPAASFDFKVQGIEIEGSNDAGVDVQYAWEDSPRRFHEHQLQTKTFYMDKFPVTNAQFKRFLDASHYAPTDTGNFLRDWRGGRYPTGWEKKPVTWVSLEDARAYAKWAGKRLPHEWEWQLAAQGTDGRLYPWGNEWQSGAVPIPDKGRTLHGPDAVDAHLSGASAAGVMDLVGNVWQWTDEYVDEHTRAAILRGGSYYQPQGSIWYFPQAYRNDQHGKLLLMAPAYDRSATVGFRCASE